MARVLLVFGGRSAEHEVSCVSAVAVGDALRASGHEVIPVGIARDGGWHLVDADRRPLHAEGRPARFVIPDGVVVAGADEVAFDVAFPVLHGPFGEDGTIQGLLEMAGKPFVGCGVLASAVAMDKEFTKRVAASHGIPSARWLAVHRAVYDADPKETVDRVVDDFGGTVFVKPAALGSSVGISKADAPQAVKEALDEAFRHGDKVIVEEAVRGREIEVAVLDGPRASLPGEVLPGGEWYDYRSKYEDERSVFVAPADLDGAATAEVRRLANAAFSSLDCRGLARVDFFFEEWGRGFLLNEVNTMPGFTP
ncbi:MAG: D-alanine--D-alanine ligase, partial [Actinobacteria bacterium]